MTLAKLRVTVNDRNVTEYSYNNGDRSEHLEIPVYFLAEWLAENWWPLLWEPRKSEDVGDDPDFLARHSILTAQHGFALPKLSIIPHGESILVAVVSREVEFSNIRFRNGGSISLLRKETESELKRFVGGVAERLVGCSIERTGLQEVWSLIENTAEDEMQFCQFMGALGLSPYAENDRIEETLDRVSSNIGSRLTLDLCLASTPENFDSSAHIAELAHVAMSSAPSCTLEPLAAIPIPADNYSVPGYQRGVEAARRVRNKLGFKENDPHGANSLFEILKIDPTKITPNIDAGADNSIIGAVAREDLDAKIVLLQRMEVKRRFAAARAAYTAWDSEGQDGSRLMTHVVTRDQQASRAFAAEITAPIAYLRHAAKRSKLSQERVFELAANLNIGPDVVRKHAQNNGLEIMPT